MLPLLITPLSQGVYMERLRFIACPSVSHQGGPVIVKGETGPTTKGGDATNASPSFPCPRVAIAGQGFDHAPRHIAKMAGAAGAVTEIVSLHAETHSQERQQDHG